MKQFCITSFLFLFSITVLGQYTQSHNKNIPGHLHKNTPVAYSKPMYNPLMEKYDVTFYKLDLVADNTSTYIEGNVSVHATVQNAALDTFVIELFDDYTVDSVLIDGNKLSHVHVSQDIKVPLTSPLSIGSAFVAQVFYHGQLNDYYSSLFVGIAYDEDTEVTYTLSEPFFSKFWFPCKQVLEDKADSVYVFVTTDEGLKVGSNGLLTATTPMGGGKVRYEWKSRYPIAYYLISICISDYIEYNLYAKPDELDDSILVQNYLYSEQYLNVNKAVIDLTDDLIVLFSDLFGMYPFKDEKYGHCTAPIGGGMEHQTMSTMAGYSFELVSHELAHMWFGDYVTCATWQDIWINEGFATYSHILAREYIYSEPPGENLQYYIYDQVAWNSQGSVYIPSSEMDIDFGNGAQVGNLTWRIFDWDLSYAKGALLLHMMRFELNDDDMFYETLHTFLSQYKDSVATGMDFKAVLESVSGQDFTDFFNQWYFGEGYPIYNITWDQEDETLTIHTVQTTSSTTSLFKMPLEYKLLYSGGDTTIRLYQNINDQTFTVDIPYTITNMVVDPDHWVLARFEGVNQIDDPLYYYNFASAYPNPFTQYITVQFSIPDQKHSVLLRDVAGRIVMQYETRDQMLRIDTGHLPKGIYFVEINSGDKGMIQKMVKQ